MVIEIREIHDDDEDDSPYTELKAPKQWVGVRTRGGKRFWSEISKDFTNEDGKEIKEHEFLGYYNTPHEAAVIRDARVIEMKLPLDELNFPYLDPQRIVQLANQSKERRVRANERMTLGIGRDQTLDDLVETFKEESNSDVPLLERQLVDIPIPSVIREQENFSGIDKQYRYFIWGQDQEFFLDKYERDSEYVWIRRWDEPKIYSSLEEATAFMQAMIYDDNKEQDDGKDPYNSLFS